MIHINKSYQLQSLCLQLADNLYLDEASKRVRNPLQPVPIIVPNQDTGKWLALELAEIAGISANLDMMLPAEWHWRQIRRFWPNLPRKTVSDLYPLYWALFEMFDTSGFNELPGPVAGYIHYDAELDVSEPDVAVRTQRSAQIAFQIATLFDKYLNNRPKLMLSWTESEQGGWDADQTGIDQKVANLRGTRQKGEDHEIWQAELWRNLCKTWKETWPGDEEKQLHKAELWNKTNKFLANLRNGDTLYIFNPGLIPEPTVRLIQSYGKHQTVHIYRIFQPFWEHGSEPQKKSLSQDSLLKNLGKETPKFNALYDTLGKVSENYDIPDDNTLLSNLKKRWIGRTDRVESGGRLEKDPSIQIRSCHSPLREMEVLHAFLLDRFENDPDLHPDDVLVITPDLRKYASAIDAVFGADEEDVPSVAHTTGLDRSGITEEGSSALQSLLSLLDSRFEVADVVDLFSMNPVLKKRSVSESQFKALTRWLEDNRIHWGLSEEHREWEKQPAERLHTWREAIRRIWFGVLNGGVHGDMVKGSLIYPGISSGEEKEALGAFTDYLFTLEWMVRQKKEKQTVQEWCITIDSWLQQLFEERFLQLPRSWLLDIGEEAEVAGSSIQVPFSVFKRRLLSQLGRHAAGSAVFTKGILFNSMVPMRGIPYKVIALVGLNEESYPRKTIESEFDLMAKDPFDTDRDRRDEDRQMFLESIFAAKKIHYVSFVGQDIRDNEEKAVSTVVSEWVTYLSERTNTHEKDWIQKEPLSIYSMAHYKDEATTSVFSGTAAATSKKLYQTGENRHGFCIDTRLELAEVGERIHLDDLVNFFGNPYRQFVKKQLETSLISAGSVSSEFDMNTLETYQLFETMLGLELQEDDQTEIHQRILASGQLPGGYLGELKLKELDALVKTAIQQLKVQADTRGDRIDVREVPVSFPVQIDDRHLIIDGSVRLFLEKENFTVQQSDFSGKWGMQHWVRHLACLLNTPGAKPEYSVLLNLKKTPKVVSFSVPEDPQSLFLKMIRYYLGFLEQPDDAYPAASFEYVKEFKKNGDESKAQIKAKKKFTFDTGDYSFGNDLNDLYTGRIVGVHKPFRASFVQGLYTEFVGQMKDHVTGA